MVVREEARQGASTTTNNTLAHSPNWNTAPQRATAVALALQVQPDPRGEENLNSQYERARVAYSIGKGRSSNETLMVEGSSWFKLFT